VNLPPDFSLISNGTDGVLATGPFVIDMVLDGERYQDLGFDLTELNDKGVSWSGLDHGHVIVPAAEPALVNREIRFTNHDGDSFVIRPLALGDGALVGFDDPSVPANELEGKRSLRYLAEYLYRGYTGETVEPFLVSEDNLYLTRSEDGEPLALVKMSGAHPTLIRQDSGWRPLGDDEDELLGTWDLPVKEEAVLAWDSGNIQELPGMTMSDRISPDEVSAVWLEVSDAGRLTRLLIQRSRDRFYSRVNGDWKKATPDPNATTLDVSWSAIGAWDTGDLRRLSQAAPYDVNGQAA
jgi:hypothetical protein